MIQNFLPLGSYSKPLARKIGLEAAVLLFELIKDYGNNPFKNSNREYHWNLGIVTATWAVEKLIALGLIKEFNGDLHIVDYDVLNSFLDNNENIKTEQMSKSCLDACKKWIKFLKEKKGVNKDLGSFLNEVEGKDEMDIIAAINKSFNNNWKTLYFAEKEYKDKKEKRGWNL